MPVIAETAAPRHVRLEALARDGCVRRRADRARLWRETHSPPTWPERMQRETGTRFKDWVDHLVVRGGPGLPDRLADAGLRAPADHVRRRRAGLRASRRDLSPDRARAGRVDHERRTRLRRAGSGDQGRVGGGLFAGPRPGPGDRRLSDGPVPGRPGRRASGRRWPWSSAAATWASSRFRASWRARDG